MRRAGIAAIIDQGSWSASTLVMSVLSGFNVGAATFGLIGAAYALLLVGQGAIRAVALEPLVIHGSSGVCRRGSRRRRAAGGLAVCLAISAAGLLLAISWVPPQGAVEVYALLPVSLAASCAMDVLRFDAMLGRRHVWLASINVSQCALFGLAALLSYFSGSAPTGVASWRLWVVSLVASSILLSVIYLVAHGQTGWASDENEPADDGVPVSTRLRTESAVDWLLRQGIGYLLVPLAAFMGGFSVAAPLRGAQVIFGPVNVLFAGLVTSMVPSLRTVDGRQRQAVLRRLRGLLGSAAVLWGAALTATPAPLGAAVLGESYVSGMLVLAPFLVQKVAAAVLTVQTIDARLRRSVMELVAGRLVSVPVLLGLALVLGNAFDAFGFATAFAASTWVLVAVVSLRQRRKPER